MESAGDGFRRKGIIVNWLWDVGAVFCMQQIFDVEKGIFAKEQTGIKVDGILCNDGSPVDFSTGRNKSQIAVFDGLMPLQEALKQLLPILWSKAPGFWNRVHRCQIFLGGDEIKEQQILLLVLCPGDGLQKIRGDQVA